MSITKNINVKLPISFLGALTLLFVWAKLDGLISWSWWLIFAPLLWPFYLVIGVFAIALLVAALEMLT